MFPSTKTKPYAFCAKLSYPGAKILVTVLVFIPSQFCETQLKISFG